MRSSSKKTLFGQHALDGPFYHRVERTAFARTFNHVAYNRLYAFADDIALDVERVTRLLEGHDCPRLRVCHEHDSERPPSCFIVLVAGFRNFERRQRERCPVQCNIALWDQWRVKLERD